MSTNKLADQLSPYLLQHAGNPVQWWPWCAEAFQTARRLDKPVFLSVGYATCHWCHVMEKESFSDREAAAVLNRAFVCVKVDREQRPDVDAVFMAACQVLGGNCGWPLTIVMTPDKKPFFAATYLPKTNSFGQPGLMEIGRKISSLWHNEREMVENTASQVAKVLAGSFSLAGMEGEIGADIFENTCGQLEAAFDAERGGFNGAPKFPMAHRLVFLMRQAVRTANLGTMKMATASLEAMRRGGIWDHVGLGFHRYSTDADWILPHFEKMLYDQALLAMAYLEACLHTGDELWAATAREIFEYVADRLTDSCGGFYTAQDADSQGEEGRYYLWRFDEFAGIADKQGPVPWTRIFNLHPEGNFTDPTTGRSNGMNVLYLSRNWQQWAAELDLDRDRLADKWESLRRKLYLERGKRPAPLTDDKILADWNGLMIAALAMGARVLKQDRYRDAACRAADFILSEMTADDGSLHHALRRGHIMAGGLASDYAYFITGLLELYRATFDVQYLEKAVQLQELMDDLFWDHQEGGYFLAPARADDLPVLPKDLYDGALPSVNGVALGNLARLHGLTGRTGWREKARVLGKAFGAEVVRQPTSFTGFLCSLDMARRPVAQVVIAASRVGRQVSSILERLGSVHGPQAELMVKTAQNSARLERIAPFAASLQPGPGGKTRIYLLRNGQTTAFAPDDSGLDRLLEKLRPGRS